MIQQENEYIHRYMVWKALRGLLQFRFRRHGRYNLPPQRLKMIEKQIQKRAGLLLEEN